MAKLTIKEAAEQLGISEVTVRRRLKKRELIGEQVLTSQGYTWLVTLADDGETVTSRDDRQHEATIDHVLVEELRGQVDDLKQELAERRREHDRDRDDWREERQQLHVLLAREQETVQTLTRRIEQLPASTPPLTPDISTREEEVRHLYLSQLIAPVSVVLFPFVIPFTFGLWSTMQQGRIDDLLWISRSMLAVMTVCLGYLVLFGVRRIAANNRRLVARGTLTLETLQSRSVLATIWSWPWPERLAYGGILLGGVGLIVFAAASYL